MTTIAHYARIVIVLGLLVAGGIAVTAGPVGAHGETGTFAFEATPESSHVREEVEFRVRLTYDSDGHPAEGTDVMFELSGPGPNATFDPIILEEVDAGEYESTVVFEEPGTYNVRVSSEEPVASHTASYTVEAQAPTTTTTMPAEDGGGDAQADESEDEGTTVPWWIVILAFVLGIPILGAVVLAIRRRRRRMGKPGPR